MTVNAPTVNLHSHRLGMTSRLLKKANKVTGVGRGRRAISSFSPLPSLSSSFLQVPFPNTFCVVDSWRLLVYIIIRIPLQRNSQEFLLVPPPAPSKGTTKRPSLPLPYRACFPLPSSLCFLSLLVCDYMKLHLIFIDFFDMLDYC